MNGSTMLPIRLGVDAALMVQYDLLANSQAYTRTGVSLGAVQAFEDLEDLVSIFLFKTYPIITNHNMMVQEGLPCSWPPPFLRLQGAADANVRRGVGLRKL